MSSILTNTSAMVALQTMRGINQNLAKTQSEISTGKSVGNARDNAAVWAISRTMESDVRGFKAIGDSLALGQSSVAVARQAAETTTDLLTQMKGLIVAAQEENVDRTKIQTDIVALREQIGAVVGAAQFNGLNLVDGSSTDPVEVLSSLNRDSAGNMNPDSIMVTRQNLSVTTPVTSQAFGAGVLTDLDDYFDFGGTTVTAGGDPLDAPATVAAGASETITVGQVAEGISFQITLNDVEVNVVGGGTTQGTRVFEYVASAGDGTADVARNLENQINAFFGAATGAGYSVSTDGNELTITNGAGAPALEIGLLVAGGGTAGSSPSSGGLGALQTIDVTNNAIGALGAIDGLINQAIDAATVFGSAQGRIDTQAEFVKNLSDALTTGIGSLVDADMEAASARLQALQVQQQLATQSLSIANQQPQNILALFR
ncbi:MAG: flagellin [Rhodobacteraceae bacterium]|nr:flagellin [Paracoccaceae bacterium]